FPLLPRQDALYDENVTFINSAISRCISTCHPPHRGKHLPTRLLDLESVRQDHTLCLICTKDLITDETLWLKYAALNYSWGRPGLAPQPMTAPDNLAERLHSISLDEMSAVAQDAIEVCAKLSIRHLWIDALCILQGPGGKDDWERESQIMDAVFARAYITLCAASSPSSHVAFPDRKAKPRLRILRRPRVHTTGPSSPSPVESYMLTPFYDHEQELSQRQLIFSHDLIHFRCPGRMLCENGWEQGKDTESTRYSSFADMTLATTISADAPLMCQKDPEQKQKVFQLFRDSVEGFGQKRLTYETDRLPAMAGLAKMVSGFIGSEYHAGLWQDVVHEDLIFFRTYPPKPSGSDTLQVPSWPWASKRLSFLQYPWEGPAVPQYASIQILTTPKELSRFGEVEGGFLTIETKVLLSSALLSRADSGMFTRISISKSHDTHLADVQFDQGITKHLRMCGYPPRRQSCMGFGHEHI
ncbi:hypothetical protein B0T25DRAFT_456993, partial [Lasiosphaeria hispida]